MDSLFFLVYVDENGDHQLWEPENYMCRSLPDAMSMIKVANESNDYVNNLNLPDHEKLPKLIGIQAYRPQFMSYLEMEE